LEQIIIIVVIGFLVYMIFSLIKKRYLTSHDDGIKNHLSKNGLDLLKVIEPSPNDWKKSPFKKPPLVKVSFVQIKFFGAQIDPNEKEYRIINAKNSNNHVFRIWMEIDTSIMGKTKIEYKKEKRK